MARGILKLLTFGLIILASVAFLPNNSAADTDVDWHYVLAVPSSKTIVLDNGATVRLAAIQLPNSANKVEGRFRLAEPMGEEARQALYDLVYGKKVRLEYVTQKVDRYNRYIAFVWLQDGRLLQQELLAEGWAMLYVFYDSKDWLPRLLPFEKQARKAEKGIWKSEYWQIKPADKVPADKERYMLVEGVLRKATKLKGRWYLNFGDNWRRDFTAMINKDNYRKYFAKQNFVALEGKKLRLRGWVYDYNGAMMDIILPQQIEIIN